MPKIGMKPIRRAQLIEATFECIYRHGFAGTTIARVAKQAGLSTGIISHYFGNKDGLLEATMRGLLRQLDIIARTHNKDSKDPKECIIAIIGSNFAEQQVTPEATTVWLAFWAQALHVPSLTRLQRANLNRLRSNLRYWLKQLLPAARARIVADGLAAMIDGLWLYGAFQQGGIQQDEARRICLNYLDLELDKG